MLRELGVKGLKVDVSSVCNLNCEYCYIPKSKALHRMNAEVFKSLDNVTKFLGEISYLTIWGAEPAFGLGRISEVLSKGDYHFNQIHFSTNMTLDPQIYLKALRAFKGKTRSVRMQASLDGPKEQHDMTRGKGTWEKVTNNIRELIKLLNNEDLGYTLYFSFNTVIDARVMAWYVEDLTRVDRWFEFTEEFIRELRSMSTNPNVYILKPLSPNLAIPGKYTKEDGRNFAKVVDRFIENGYTLGQFKRFADMIVNLNDVITKTNNGNVACGAVFGGLGWDRGTFHVCHRTYWLQDDEYVDEILPKYTDWWTSRFDKGTIENVRRHIVKDDDEYNLIRMVYTLGATQIYPQLNVNYNYAMAKMLAKIGQINKVYLEKDWMAKLLALYLATAMKCMSENLMVTGSVHVTPTSYFKLFGNGAFERLVEHHKKEVLEAWS